MPLPGKHGRHVHRLGQPVLPDVLRPVNPGRCHVRWGSGHPGLLQREVARIGRHRLRAHHLRMEVPAGRAAVTPPDGGGTAAERFRRRPAPQHEIIKEEKQMNQDQVVNIFFLILPFIIYALYIIVPVAIVWGIVILIKRKKRGDQK